MFVSQSVSQYRKVIISAHWDQYLYQFYIIYALPTRLSIWLIFMYLHWFYLTFIAELFIWQDVFISSWFSSWKWNSGDQPCWHVFISSRLSRVLLLCWIMVRIFIGRHYLALNFLFQCQLFLKCFVGLAILKLIHNKSYFQLRLFLLLFPSLSLTLLFWCAFSVFTSYQ